jgi:endogenous inhibitor of DNA gyrase (YacG/DUF329 family)
VSVARQPGGARAARSRGKSARECPICGKPVAQDHRPFCSRRCAEVDLGRWLGGRYAVPGEPLGARDRGDEEDA